MHERHTAETREFDQFGRSVDGRRRRAFARRSVESGGQRDDGWVFMNGCGMRILRVRGSTHRRRPRARRLTCHDAGAPAGAPRPALAVKVVVLDSQGWLENVQVVAIWRAAAGWTATGAM